MMKTKEIRRVINIMRDLIAHSISLQDAVKNIMEMEE